MTRFKYTRQVYKNQAVLSSTPNISSLSLENQQIITAIKDLTYAECRILDHIVSLSYSCKEIYPSYKYIAQRCGVTERTVQRACGKLRRLGLLKIAGKYKGTSRYFINPLILNACIREEIKYLLPSLILVFNKNSIKINSLQSVKCPTIRDSLFKKLKHKAEASTLPMLRHTTERQCTRARVYESNQKSWSSMKQDEVYGSAEPTVDELVPAAAMRFKSLALTRAGQIALSAYPNDIIEKADKRLATAGGVEDPMGYVHKICIAECRERKIEPDWKKRATLLSFYSVSDNSLLYENYVPKVKKPSTYVAGQSFKQIDRSEPSSYSPGVRETIDPNSSIEAYRKTGQREYFGAQSNERERVRKEKERIRLEKLADIDGESKTFDSIYNEDNALHNLKKVDKNYLDEYLRTIREVRVMRLEKQQNERIAEKKQLDMVS